MLFIRSQGIIDGIFRSRFLFDELVKSQNPGFVVIPAKAGIQDDYKKMKSNLDNYGLISKSFVFQSFADIKSVFICVQI
jgi:hypothetical protein